MTLHTRLDEIKERKRVAEKFQSYANMAEIVRADVPSLISACERMREALEFYSAGVKYHTHWKNGHGLNRTPANTTQMEIDSGHIARTCLAELDQMKDAMLVQHMEIHHDPHETSG